VPSAFEPTLRREIRFFDIFSVCRVLLEHGAKVNVTQKLGMPFFCLSTGLDLSNRQCG
jgi:hypothetical protein